METKPHSSGTSTGGGGGRTLYGRKEDKMKLKMKWGEETSNEGVEIFSHISWGKARLQKLVPVPNINTFISECVKICMPTSSFVLDNGQNTECSYVVAETKEYSGFSSPSSPLSFWRIIWV